MAGARTRMAPAEGATRRRGRSPGADARSRREDRPSVPFLFRDCDPAGRVIRHVTAHPTTAPIPQVPVDDSSVGWRTRSSGATCNSGLMWKFLAALSGFCSAYSLVLMNREGGEDAPWPPRRGRRPMQATPYTRLMGGIARVVTKRRLTDRSPDRAWWLQRPAAERVAHVQELRADHYGWTDGTGPRLQRVHRVVHRS